MKKASELVIEHEDFVDGVIEFSNAKKNAIATINELLQKNKKIEINKIIPIGVVDTGDVQIKVPTNLKDVPVIKLIGYLMWFYEIKNEELI